MKRIIAIVLFTTLCTALSFAQTTFSDLFSHISIKANTKYEKADITWQNSPKYDFGQAQIGTPLIHEFEFTNTTNRPLIIENIETPSSCIIPDWCATPIAVNQSTKIKITYCADIEGSFNHLIQVRLRGIKRAETLYIKGQITS